MSPVLQGAAIRADYPHQTSTRSGWPRVLAALAGTIGAGLEDDDRSPGLASGRPMVPETSSGRILGADHRYGFARQASMAAAAEGRPVVPGDHRTEAADADR